MSQRENNYSSHEEEEESGLESYKISNPKLKGILDFQNSDFVASIKNSPKCLKKGEAKNFFKIIFHHLNDRKLDIKLGKLILNAIRKLITKNEIYEVFQNNSFLYKLPYKRREYNDEIFAIIYDLCFLDPDIFDETFADADHFQIIAKNDPRKALCIITKYAQKFIEADDIEDPWPFLDILVYCSSSFFTPELIRPYASLVLYLIQGSEDYKVARLRNFWHIYVKHASDSSELPCHPIIYTSLAHILDLGLNIAQGVPFPIEGLRNDLRQIIAQEPVLEFIIAYSKYDLKPLNDFELIQTLLFVAKDNIKALITLLVLAKNEEIASTILGYGQWMVESLPEAVDTLRLFLVVFSHVSLRPDIIACQYFIPALNKFLTEMNSPGIVMIVCTIIRRIPLYHKFVQKLSKENFIKTFVNIATNNNDDKKISAHSLLLFINTLAPYGFCHEFLKLIPIISGFLTDKNLCEIASYVAVKLTHDEECLNKMMEFGFHVFFTNHLNDTRSEIIRNNAKQFLELYNNYHVE